MRLHIFFRHLCKRKTERARERGDIMGFKTVFKRYEIKYLINLEQKNIILDAMKPYMELDEYGRTTIRNIYYDTDSFRLIRDSMEKPVYKEKLRVRSYCTANEDSTVFVELKKKYKGVVYKRRVSMPMKDVFEYIDSGKPPFDSQIMREIDYLMRFYQQPKPNVCILCEREAYFLQEDENIRLTFDKNLRYRFGFPNEENLSKGISIVNEGEYILEIKTPGAMPLWLAHALSECEIYPAKFSKYAHAYYDIKNMKEKE